MKVKDEKKTKTNKVTLETSTSPRWKDKKIFIRNYFFNPNIVVKFLLCKTINSEGLQHQI